MAIRKMEDAIDIGTAIQAAESLYYAALDEAVLRAQNEETPSSIPIVISPHLIAACREVEATKSLLEPGIMGAEASIGGNGPATSPIPFPTTNALVTCYFIWHSQQLERVTIKLKLSSLPHSRVPVLELLEALEIESGTHEGLHRKWRYLLESPSKFRIYNSTHLPVMDQELDMDDMNFVDDMNFLGSFDTLRHDSANVILQPASGTGISELTQEFGCGEYWIDLMTIGEELRWLPIGEVYCIVVVESAPHAPGVHIFYPSKEFLA